MKYVVRFLVVMLVFIAEQASACGRTYTMSHSGDYVPYQYQHASGALVGLDVEMFRGIIKEMGCVSNLILLPPKRAQLMLKTGDLDVMAAASITAERHQFAHFSLPYRDEKLVMFVNETQADSLRTVTLTQAVRGDLTIVAGLGGWYGKEYEAIKQEGLASGALRLNNSTEARFRQLLSGRVDIVLADLFVGYHHATRLGKRSAIVDLPHVLNADPAHFMLSRKTVNGSELEQFNQALSRFVGSDDYKALILKYRPLTGLKN